MKRVGYLYEKIFTKENLELAIRNAYKNQKHKSRKAKYMFEHLEDTIKDLQANRKLSGKYNIIEHYNSLCKKTRIIATPTFRDLIIQHALIQVILPILNKGEYKYSCACIKKKGNLYASMSLRKMIRKTKHKKTYYLKIDIKKYFPNIDINVLYTKLTKKIKDKKVLEFIKELLTMYKGGGLPIGWYSSQIFANFYLTDFDHYVKEELKIPYYVRYMDDMHFIDYNKRKLRKCLLKIRQYLNLKTHTNKEFVIKYINFIDLCGYRHYKSGKITIRRNIYHRILKVVKGLKKWLCQKRIKRFNSYLGFLKYSNSKTLINKLNIGGYQLCNSFKMQ